MDWIGDVISGVVTILFGAYAIRQANRVSPADIKGTRVLQVGKLYAFFGWLCVGIVLLCFLTDVFFEDLAWWLLGLILAMAGLPGLVLLAFYYKHRVV